MSSTFNVDFRNGESLSAKELLHFQKLILSLRIPYLLKIINEQSLTALLLPLSTQKNRLGYAIILTLLFELGSCNKWKSIKKHLLGFLWI